MCIRDSHKAGRDAQILDAYVYGNWDVGNMPVSGRLGKQVFNWGEGLFYRGGVNTTNPVDAAKFRLPGSEVKEVLVPVEALSFNIGLTDNLSMETFYPVSYTHLDVYKRQVSVRRRCLPTGHAMPR